MKLNFWQWLGVAMLLVAGIIYVISDKSDEERKGAPATQPAAV